jgi:hypothetical protein
VPSVAKAHMLGHPGRLFALDFHLVLRTSYGNPHYSTRFVERIGSQDVSQPMWPGPRNCWQGVLLVTLEGLTWHQ